MDAQAAAPGGLSPSVRNVVRLAVVGLVSLILFYAAYLLYTVGQSLIGSIILAVAVAFAIIFGTDRYYALRFIFPGVSAVMIFIAFPVLYTIYLGFTNYSSFNLLHQKDVIEVLQSGKIIDKSTERNFSLVAEGSQFRLYFPSDAGNILTDPVTLDGKPVTVDAKDIGTGPTEILPMKEVMKNRKAIAEVLVNLPDGSQLKSTGLRTFARMTPEYELQADGRLKRVTDGSFLTPDQSTGFYVTDTGEKVPPGWRVTVGFDNFKRIFTLQGMRGPLVSIFVWTVVFATLSTLLTFAVGFTLASILQWPHLSFRSLYQVLLILPYAVPAFISILVFRGLFNQNFGEINLFLETFFGIRPTWQTDAGMARTMILIVNVWLGYPYMMLLSMGFLQAIPLDQKKAASLEGAGVLRVLWTITLPQIIPPFLPMLISTFAFNFNNIVLILLLTRGLPDIPGTVIPAGQTDILGSFTYRMSFMDTGQQFGLAGAITFLIFIVVGSIAYANFVAMRRVANRTGA